LVSGTDHSIRSGIVHRSIPILLRIRAKRGILKSDTIHYAVSSTMTIAQIWISWTWSSMSWICVSSYSGDSIDSDPLHFSSSTLNLWGLKDLCTVHHLLHERIDLVIGLLNHIITGSWLEWYLESNLQLVFRQDVIGNWGFVISFTRW
jgi:hypothetical protein